MFRKMRSLCGLVGRELGGKGGGEVGGGRGGRDVGGGIGGGDLSGGRGGLFGGEVVGGKGRESQQERRVATGR